MRAAIVLALLTTAATAHAEGNELSLGESMRTLNTTSAKAVTADGMVGGSVGYARQLNLPVAPHLAVWADATFGWGSADGTMFQTLTTSLDSLMVGVGGRARYQLHRLVV